LKKAIGCIVLVSMLCISMSGAVGFAVSETSYNKNSYFFESHTSNLEDSTTKLKTTVDKYLSMDMDNYKAIKTTQMDIDLPWVNINKNDLLEWIIHLEYNGQKFDKQVDVSISDFSEKFLKHPEYGEILYFDIDNDVADDVEVIIGFYWSIIKYPDGQDARSLESRLRVRQMPDGGIQDANGDLEVWSQLKVNYGLISEPGRSRSIPKSISDLRNVLKENYQPGFLLRQFVDKLTNEREERLSSLRNIINKLFGKFLRNNGDKFSNCGDVVQLASDDNDYIAIGAGYHSPAGQKIPLLVEKRFSFAKGINWKSGSIFNPTIFQHKMDPGGTEPIELLYGFQAYSAGSTNPSYDVAFSVEFDPAVYLITKFIPTDGVVYYFFDQESYSGETKITFSADVGAGSEQDIPSLSLTFDRIDSDLAQSGRWLMFDLDIIDGDLLGGGFHYKASHKHSIGIEVNALGFEEKVKMDGIPTSIDFGWDVDLDFAVAGPNMVDVVFGGGIKLNMNSKIDKLTVYYPKSNPADADVTFIEVSDIPSIDLDARASLYMHRGSMLTVRPSGSIDLDMSSSIGEINVYYPKADPNSDPDNVFINVPDGSIPRSVELGAVLDVHVDLGNLMNSNNYIYGRVYHDCNTNMKEIEAYIPGEEIPIVKITDIPADASFEGRLNWGQMSGFAYATRGYIGGFDPVEVNLEFGGFKIYNKLEIRQGHITTSFQIAEDGYFNFDTSDKMLGNTLRVDNVGSGTSLKRLELLVDEVSADNLQTDWDIDTSGNQPKINSLDFSGVINTLKGLHLNLNLKGESSSLDLDWVTGQTGYLEIDFQQDGPIRLDFNLDDQIEGVDFHGYVELPNDPHFDMSWKWKQGTSSSDPGYFKINENTNEESIEDMYLYLTYQDLWGAEVSLSNAGIYVCVDWYWYNLLLYIWPVIDIYGDVELNLLLDGQWYYNVEDWVNPP